jgi:hypothetical protein
LRSTWKKPWGASDEVSLRPSRRSTRGERRSEAVVGQVEQETSKDPNSRRQSPCGARLTSNPRWSFLQRDEPRRGEPGERSLLGVSRTQRKPQEGHGVREGIRRSRRSKASKGEPQEWNRDEISPGDHMGSKAARGCETLRSQHNRVHGWIRRYVALCGWENAEGEQTSEGSS